MKEVVIHGKNHPPTILNADFFCLVLFEGFGGVSVVGLQGGGGHPLFFLFKAKLVHF